VTKRDEYEAYIPSGAASIVGERFEGMVEDEVEGLVETDEDPIEDPSIDDLDPHLMSQQASQ
jgi:hypothetical protein